jgi:hypothetical protein
MVLRYYTDLGIGHKPTCRSDPSVDYTDSDQVPNPAEGQDERMRKHFFVAWRRMIRRRRMRRR